MIQKIKNDGTTFALIIILLCSVFFCFLMLDHQDSFVKATATESDENWIATLTMSGSDGTGFKLEFGESENASDGVDQLDMPIPPSPPVIPHINARFLTPFDPPNTELYKEMKLYPDTNKTWNFSVIWFAGPGNTSKINITLKWNISELKHSEYKTIQLLKNNSIVSEMLESNLYYYETSSNHPAFFSIMGSDGQTANTTNSNGNNHDSPVNTPFFPFILLILLIFSICFYKKVYSKNK